MNFYTNLPMKMEQTECSETSAYKFRRRGITQKKTYNEPLTVCCQLATCFCTVGPLPRNFQQLLFSLYNYFKLLMMDEGGQNMQQADCRQFWVSH